MSHSKNTIRASKFIENIIYRVTKEKGTGVNVYSLSYHIKITFGLGELFVRRFLNELEELNKIELSEDGAVASWVFDEVNIDELKDIAEQEANKILRQK